MTWTPIERIPAEELALRHARCRDLLAACCPDAAGLMAFSRVNIYWLTGTLGNGLLWLPREGEPILLLRRGMERAQLECPLPHIHPFRSYSDVPGLLAEAGSPLPDNAPIAVGMSGLPWSLGQLLTAKLPQHAFINGDKVLQKGRAKKTPWELSKLRLGGERHHMCLHDLLPELLRPGMSERELSHMAWAVFFGHGHCGNMRMSNFGEEIFLGHVAAGESANYPSVFNGPVGVRGEHPASPFAGYAGTAWTPGTPLVMDIGFCLEGYHTDKTQIYWAGSKASLPDEVKAAHAFCVEVQTRAAHALRPGARPSDIYADAVARAHKAGYADGFMALDNNKVVFLGHGIGLAIDEYPVLAKGFDEPLEEGMVLALEPKMGIRGLGMVGVENTFEVTPEGGKCITGHAYDIVCIDG